MTVIYNKKKIKEMHLSRPLKKNKKPNNHPKKKNISESRAVFVLREVTLALYSSYC